MNKSFCSVKFNKLEMSSFVNKGGSGSFNNDDGEDLEYVNVDIMVDELC